ncbi:unnamed protein product [Cylindrotheca closterium]|uniref:Kinesin light chain n=1 Tax=Cylindrotheca closterium TaxID=2856 RepID=A0AAD2JGJ6_9STRA|nr:unnamed protein product [Cylindrotheca closterium]
MSHSINRRTTRMIESIFIHLCFLRHARTPPHLPRKQDPFADERGDDHYEARRISVTFGLFSSENHNDEISSDQSSAGQPVDRRPPLPAAGNPKAGGLNHKREETIDQDERRRLTLATKLKTLAPEHPYTSSYREIGNYLQGQGRLEEAMQQYHIELQINLGSFGLMHSETATTCFCIGTVLCEHGKREEALEQYQLALAIRLTTLGPHHAEIGSTCHAIGVVLGKQGKLEEALEQLKKALAIRLQAFGPHHTKTGATYEAIGVVLGNQFKFEEALQPFRMALAINMKAFGPKHPFTACTYQNLRLALKIHCMWEVVCQKIEKALAINKWGALLRVLNKKRLGGTLKRFQQKAIEMELKAFGH